MTQLPSDLFTSDAVRQIDDIAINDWHEDAYGLMRRAGQAAFNLLKSHWPNAKNIVIYCGGGNNGGDGFVLARLAKMDHLNVRVYQVGNVDENKLSATAVQARSDWLALDESIMPFDASIDGEADVLVDAILGTGFKSPLRKPVAEAIEIINQHKKNHQSQVLSLDIPSGLDGTTGEAPDNVVYADLTITFIGLKIGLFCSKAYDVVGQLYFDHLGIDIDKQSTVKPVAHRIEYQSNIIQRKMTHLKSRHKGDNGHVLIVGGGESCYAGAPILCAEAAYRAGAGLVSICVAPQAMPLMARAIPEIMVYSFEDVDKLSSLMNKVDIIIVGPGLGRSQLSKDMFQFATAQKKPLVIDADGLHFLGLMPTQSQNRIVTPHPGEAAQLLNQHIIDIQRDRLKAVKALQEKFSGTVILKGQGTLICHQNDMPLLYAESISNLATAGTGDVLAGVIGGLWAQTADQRWAAHHGVTLHGQAGKEEHLLGARGMVASDLLLHIRALLG